MILTNNYLITGGKTENCVHGNGTKLMIFSNYNTEKLWNLA